jgi:hypothetical protein
VAGGGRLTQERWELLGVEMVGGHAGRFGVMLVMAAEKVGES